MGKIFTHVIVIFSIGLYSSNICCCITYTQSTVQSDSMGVIASRELEHGLYRARIQAEATGPDSVEEILLKDENIRATTIIRRIQTHPVIVHAKFGHSLVAGYVQPETHALALHTYWKQDVAGGLLSKVAHYTENLTEAERLQNGRNKSQAPNRFLYFETESAKLPLYPTPLV